MQHAWEKKRCKKKSSTAYARSDVINIRIHAYTALAVGGKWESGAKEGTEGREGKEGLRTYLDQRLGQRVRLGGLRRADRVLFPPTGGAARWQHVAARHVGNTMAARGSAADGYSHGYSRGWGKRPSLKAVRKGY